MKIITRHVYPPIPDRHHDWSACLDEEGVHGYGRTEREAIEDLVEQLRGEGGE